MDEGTNPAKDDILQDSNAWQKAILDSTDLTVISTDLKGKIVTCNAGTLKRLGYEANEIIGKSPRVFHDPQEIEQRRQELSRELNCAVAPEEVFTIRASKGLFPDESDWTYICKDGRRYIGHVCVTALQDESGAVIGFLKIGKDVTEQRKIENALRESKARFQTFMDNSPALATIKDAQGRFVFANKRFCGEFPQSHEEIIGKTLYDIMTDEVAKAMQKRDEIVLRDNEQLSSEETVVTADGKTKIWLSFRFPLQDANGNQLLGSISIDITQRKYYEKQLEDYQIRLEKAINQLETLASTDALSGLKNKGSFLTRLEEEIVRARRYELPLSLLILDVDKFKEYNDSYGHPAGDEILKRIASLLKEHARPGDFVARVGGEEFAIILSDTPIQGAFVVGERLRRAVENSSWDIRRITISVGIAEVTEQNTESIDVYQAADKALYRAKENGRNQVAQ